MSKKLAIVAPVGVDYFRAGGVALREMAANGDTLAQAEIDRRKANRAAKSASAAA